MSVFFGSAAMDFLSGSQPSRLHGRILTRIKSWQSLSDAKDGRLIDCRTLFQYEDYISWYKDGYSYHKDKSILFVQRESYIDLW